VPPRCRPSLPPQGVLPPWVCFGDRPDRPGVYFGARSDPVVTGSPLPYSFISAPPSVTPTTAVTPAASRCTAV
jgi:hypothetical protein